MRGSTILMAVFLTCMMTVSAIAQGYHFIYIQADGQQPFYLKHNGKNYSSSSVGYLILPKLGDGSFTIQIGFPKNLYPEQTFNLSVAGKDYGYALKNFADKGWGLFNFQTTDIVMNVNAAAAETTAQTVTTNTSNPFGNMLADAINDSTLNQQRVAVADGSVTKKRADSAVKSLQDSLPVVTSNANTESIHDSQPAGVTAASVVDSTMKKYINPDLGQNKMIAAPDNSIVKSAEHTTGSGTDITFLDNAGKDTIHAFIPSVDTVGANKKAATADITNSKADNPVFNNNNTSATQPVFTDTASATGGTVGAITNSNCQKMISSYDVDKLRKKIAKSDSQNEILEVIKKALRDKCMTTEQVKDFGNLFSSDENRYNFYDTVYPFVSDYFNFSQLQSTLIDTYYKNRFKALLR